MYTTHYTDDLGITLVIAHTMIEIVKILPRSVNNGSHVHTCDCTSRGPAPYFALFYVILDIHPILWQIKSDIPIVH